jgi:hypothetical protein
MIYISPDLEGKLTPLRRAAACVYMCMYINVYAYKCGRIYIPELVGPVTPLTRAAAAGASSSTLVGSYTHIYIYIDKHIYIYIYK